MENIFTPFEIISFHNTEYVNRPFMLPHSHGNLEIYYIAEGVATVSFSENQNSPMQTVECASGQFVVFRPNSIHAINQNSSTLKVYNFELALIDRTIDVVDYLKSSKYVKSFPTAIKLIQNWKSVLLFTDNQNVAHYLRKFKNYSILEKDSFYTDSFYYANIEIDLKRLFLDIIKCSLENLDTTGQSIYIKKTIQHLETYYNKNIDITEFSKQLGISSSYLQKLFKSHFNETITQKLTSIRLRKAKQLLKETNLTIIDVAKYSGYNSLQSFDTAFKKYTGVSPTEFRVNELKNHVKFYREEH